jgi:methylenetetrahydrofolate dehydrogenase (NADP+)/methenyltetrahydrofolate cyclohydrolase
MATILDGNKTALDIHSEVATGVINLRNEFGAVPGLAAVLVGDDPASAIYVRRKGKTCQKVGIHTKTIRLNNDTTQEQLQATITELNTDPAINGILVQLPLPNHINSQIIQQTISPKKDVDGLHPFNVGLLMQGTPLFVPATPAGVQQLLIRNGYNPAGKHVAICGRSDIVGKPLAILLAQKHDHANATVTICHTGTKDLKETLQRADIVVAAVGKPRAITSDMINPGTIVVDVGINRVPDMSRKTGYRLEGDVDFTSVEKKAKAISKVPGGVGPMTIAMLLVNTLKAATLHTQTTTT